MPSPVAPRMLKLQPPQAAKPRDAAKLDEPSTDFETELQRAKPKTPADVEQPSKSEAKRKTRASGKQDRKGAQEPVGQAHPARAKAVHKGDRKSAQQEVDGSGDSPPADPTEAVEEESQQSHKSE